MESHYCRKDSKKFYFESDFSSYQEIYKLYVNECESEKENGRLKLSYPIFTQLIKELNYYIFKPRKDQCNLCVSHKVNNVSDELYEKHREEIGKMRAEKQNDIKNAESGLCAVFCMDVQAVKLVPQLNASAAYYKMKLQLHNFTVYNIVTHESDNYVWNETVGNLVSSVFATCIIKHLRYFHARSPETHHIIIYSDGCFHQNRNTVLSNALLNFSKESEITIEQKFLISGHTQMECDASHSLIERKINKKQINLPSQFVQLIKESRKVPAPLQAHHLRYDYFLNFENISKIYTSIRPGRGIGDHTVSMLRALAYDSSGSIYFKTNVTDEYQLLPQRSRFPIENVSPDCLYKEKIAISKKKWDHLQDLKKFLQADCHSFYDNLPYKT
ncbi:uncharacterized protein LOC126754569 [Bactrocera neohumeralis]|uniref:uncharacterized protein LOC126754569 n=1 Tax=Bactrocera neohumeralis TaxID=98809 RepID=UPI002165E206|nr:uncharacterized protein LOC126754569 [Bactrocera neohumeralis]